MNRRVGTVSEEPGAVYRLFDDMPLGVFVLRDGLLVHANAAMSRLTGVARELLVGQPVTALLWEPGRWRTRRTGSRGGWARRRWRAPTRRGCTSGTAGCAWS
ncbi:PAS domain-containing protein [Corallococcus sp. 4LFB]|uniref:PAS domain-containing protein n=1 Tax=Corallococcus sp. 4LFB TaxID=3383249 RepID=UPI003976C249